MPQTAFSIEKLRGAAGPGGFAKGQRYEVSFHDILKLGLQSAGAAANLPYLCESISLPTKSLASVPHDIYGPPREISYRETFTEAVLSFIVDDAFTVRKFFDEWQTKIINPTTNNSNYYDDYVGTIKIKRLKNDAINFFSDPAYHVELVEAYPSLVGEILLGHAQGNEVLRLSVTFKYRRWNPLD